jgi:hypothetical protein
VSRTILAATFACLLASGVTAEVTRLPAAAFEDQHGRILHLDSLRGAVVVIVYGGRAGVEGHRAWGRRLDGELRAHGVYGAEAPAATRKVQILAVAQMGGIPSLFRSMIRTGLSPHVEAGYSLWLDWDDSMSARFGAHAAASSVVVADRSGGVRLVVSGRADGEAYDAVRDLVFRLLP